jgi:hypothetical protein
LQLHAETEIQFEIANSMFKRKKHNPRLLPKIRHHRDPSHYQLSIKVNAQRFFENSASPHPVMPPFKGRASARWRVHSVIAHRRMAMRVYRSANKLAQGQSGRSGFSDSFGFLVILTFWSFQLSGRSSFPVVPAVW